MILIVYILLITLILKSKEYFDTKIDKNNPSYCGILESNISDYDHHILTNNFNNTSNIKPINQLYYYKLFNTPNKPFIPKKIYNNYSSWICRSDVNRPWYQC